MAEPMIDRHGTPITVGARVVFRIDGDGDYTIGTVRKIGAGIRGKAPEARCDDGDPANPDLFSNGFGKSAWAMASEIEVIRP